MKTNIIYNKSCTEDGMSEISDSSIDMVITSPPYFSLKDYSYWEDYKSYINFIEEVAMGCFRVLKPGGWICWNVQDSLPFPKSKTGVERYSEPLAADSIKTFQSAGFKYEKGIIWYKGQGTASQRLFGSFPSPGLILISSLTESIIFMRKSRGDFKREIDERIKQESLISKEEWSKWALDLWTIRPESAKRVGHPAPFPMEIPYRLIKMFSFINDVVLDPFMGSGTTAKAAKRCGRKYIGYEIHKKYVDLAESRLLADVDIFDD